MVIVYVAYLLEALFFNPTARGLMRLKQTAARKRKTREWGQQLIHWVTSPQKCWFGSPHSDESPRQTHHHPLQRHTPDRNWRSVWGWSAWESAGAVLNESRWGFPIWVGVVSFSGWTRKMDVGVHFSLT